MKMWIERDGQGRDVLVEEVPRSRFAVRMERAHAPVILACGLFCLGLHLDAVALPAIAGRPPSLVAGLVLTLVMAGPGVAMTVLAVLDWRRPVPESETTRHVLDADALEMVADLPDDAPVKRLVRQHGIEFG